MQVHKYGPVLMYKSQIAKKMSRIPISCGLLLDLITNICTLVSNTDEMSPFTNSEKLKANFLQKILICFTKIIIWLTNHCTSDIINESINPRQTSKHISDVSS